MDQFKARFRILDQEVFRQKQLLIIQTDREVRYCDKARQIVDGIYRLQTRGPCTQEQFMDAVTEIL